MLSAEEQAPYQVRLLVRSAALTVALQGFWRGLSQPHLVALGTELRTFFCMQLQFNWTSISGGDPFPDSPLPLQIPKPVDNGICRGGQEGHQDAIGITFWSCPEV